MGFFIQKISKNPSQKALQFEKAIKGQDLGVISVTEGCCAFNKDHCVALQDLSFHRSVEYLGTDTASLAN